MVLRSPWLVVGRPLMCSTLTEGPCSPPEQTLICLPKWVAAAWAVSSSALTLLFTHSGPSLFVVFQGGGSQRRNEIMPSEGLEILREWRPFDVLTALPTAQLSTRSWTPRVGSWQNAMGPRGAFSRGSR